MPSFWQMYIPVNHANHWILFVVRLQHQVLEIWDSLLVAEQSVEYELASDIVSNGCRPIVFFFFWYVLGVT